MKLASFFMLSFALVDLCQCPPPPPPTGDAIFLIWQELHALRVCINQMENRIRRIEFAPVLNSPGGVRTPIISRNSQGYFSLQKDPE